MSALSYTLGEVDLELRDHHHWRCCDQPARLERGRRARQRRSAAQRRAQRLVHVAVRRSSCQASTRIAAPCRTRSRPPPARYRSVHRPPGAQEFPARHADQEPRPARQQDRERCRRTMRVSAFWEMFNAFNTTNFTTYQGSLQAGQFRPARRGASRPPSAARHPVRFLTAMTWRLAGGRGVRARHGHVRRARGGARAPGRSSSALTWKASPVSPTREQTGGTGGDYNRARKMMADDANAAIRARSTAAPPRSSSSTRTGAATTCSATTSTRPRDSSARTSGATA